MIDLVLTVRCYDKDIAKKTEEKIKEFARKLNEENKELEINMMYGDYDEI